MSQIYLGFISNEMLELIKKGAAEISNGVIRSLDGTIIQHIPSLAEAGFKNIVEALFNTGGSALSSAISGIASKGPISIVNTISGLASNAQQIFIQRGIDTANASPRSVTLWTACPSRWEPRLKNWETL